MGDYQNDKYIKILEWNKSFMIQDINQQKSAQNLKTFSVFNYESVARFLDMRYLPVVDKLDWTGFTIDLVSVEVTMNFLFAMFYLFPKISNNV